MNIKKSNENLTNKDHINLVQSTPGALLLYTDTDSVKFTGEVNFSSYGGGVHRGYRVGISTTK